MAFVRRKSGRLALACDVPACDFRSNGPQGKPDATEAEVLASALANRWQLGPRGEHLCQYHGRAEHGLRARRPVSRPPGGRRG